MFASKTTGEMINNLKGRISKALTFTRDLPKEEKLSLEGIYNTIDSVILWNKELTKNKVTRFKTTLKGYAAFIRTSKKMYVIKHIVPMLDNVIEQEWIKNE